MRDLQETLQKYFWLVTALFVAGAAFFSARIAVVGIAGYVGAPREAAPKAEATRPAPAPATRLSDYRIIEERNVFNANPAKPGELGENGREAAAPQEPAAPSRLALRVVATGVRQGAPSFALIEISGDTKVYRLGNAIPPDGTLKEVLKDRVRILRGKVVEEHLLFEEKTAAAPAREAPASRAAPGGPAPPAPGGEAAASTGGDTIRQTGESTWLVDRREVEQAVQNMSQLITQIRVVPNNLPDGRTDGFRVFSIRPASLFARIGLRNGDVIKQVNGVQLSGIDQAYQAFSRLATESSIQVGIVRRDQPQTLSYEIR